MDCEIYDAETNSVEVNLSFKGQQDLLHLPASTTLADVQALAETKTGIHPAHQKIICKGKKLTDPSITLGQLRADVEVIKLVLIGTTTASLAALAEAPARLNNIRIINDLGGNMSGGIKISTVAAPVLRPRKYGFQSIEVLPHLPDQDMARRILTDLASDPGVLLVMERYKWSVGALCEMYPEGLVGVSSVCVMGLNENKGQRIFLRLRTDDLLGWRKALSVRKVLFHELAHNVHAAHDQPFHLLMRNIERDVNAFNSSGRAVGGALHLPAEGGGMPGGLFEGGSGRLGGRGASTSAQVMAGLAAIQRLSKEEQAIDDACGSGRQSGTMGLTGVTRPSERDSDNPNRSIKATLQAQEDAAHTEEKGEKDSKSPDSELVTVLPAEDPSRSGRTASGPGYDQLPSPTPSPLKPSVPENPGSLGDSSLDEMRESALHFHSHSAGCCSSTDRMDEAAAQLMGLGFGEAQVLEALHLYDGDLMRAADYLLELAAREERAGEGEGQIVGASSANLSDPSPRPPAAAIDTPTIPSDSRQARVMEAAQRLAREASEGSNAAFATLQSMLQALLEHPQELKFRRVRLNNAKFQRTVGRFPAAIDLLRDVGFQEREGGTVLEYTRGDPGLLWWGKCVVEQAKEGALP